MDKSRQVGGKQQGTKMDKQTGKKVDGQAGMQVDRQAERQVGKREGRQPQGHRAEPGSMQGPH